MAWTKTSVKDFLVLTESELALADSAGANEVTVNTSEIGQHLDINNMKGIVYVEVTEACAGDGALDCRIQASLDGTTYVNVLTTVSMDIDTTSTNKAAAKFDLSDYYAPYWRIQVFTDGTDTQDAAEIKVMVAAIPSRN
jgi:hypothetical protein